MKYSFAVACLISTSSAVQLRQKTAEPWDKDTLPDCPADTGRTIMDDGKTHVSKFPNVGATCKAQVGSASLVQFIDDTNAIQVENDPRAEAFAPQVHTLEHCPDFNERFTLADGKTKGVPWPEIGFNCNPDYQLQQKAAGAKDPNWGPSVDSLPHCPDFDERFTLADGKTKAIPYPQVYYNCKSDYQMGQKMVQKQDPNWGPSVDSLPHCPDFDERFTLADGKTKAVPYPQVYYNCKSDYQMVQKKENPLGNHPDSLPNCPDFDERMTLTDGQTIGVPYPKPYYNCKQLAQQMVQTQDPNWGPGVDSLPHCPDFDERFTLADGKTKAIPYPQVYYNCKADYQLTQNKKKDIGSDIANLEHCPDFDERFTLTDGKTRAIPYPQSNYNCNPEYAHAQQAKKQTLVQHKGIGEDVANLEHCPDFDERFMLVDGKTKAIPYPNEHYNCNPEYALNQQPGKLQNYFMRI